MTPFKLTKTETKMTALRQEAKFVIDQQAAQITERYHTANPVKLQLYAVKRMEAELFMANPEISEDSIPHIVKESERTGLDKNQIAANILNKAEEWRQLSPLIDNIRMAAIQRVNEAVNPKQIEDAKRIDWDILLTKESTNG